MSHSATGGALDPQEALDQLLGAGRARVLDAVTSTTVKSQEVIFVNGTPVELVGADGAALKAALLEGRLPDEGVLGRVLSSVLGKDLKGVTKVQSEVSVRSRVTSTDRVTVSRHGKVIDERTAETSADSEMRGRSCDTFVPPPPRGDSAPLFTPAPNASHNINHLFGVKRPTTTTPSSSQRSSSASSSPSSLCSSPLLSHRASRARHPFNPTLKSGSPPSPPSSPSTRGSSSARDSGFARSSSSAEGSPLGGSTSQGDGKTLYPHTSDTPKITQGDEVTGREYSSPRLWVNKRGSDAPHREQQVRRSNRFREGN